MQLGFIGLGKMGGPMSGRLIDAGHELTVLDVSQQAMDALVAKGAKAAKTPKEVADAADIVFTSLPTPPIVKNTALGDDGFIHGSRAKLLVDVSTTGPSTATEVAEALAKVGKQWVDCPVSGGIKGATNGTLALMVSCPNADFKTIEPVIANFGKVFHVGEKAGLGQVVKLANNMLAAAAKGELDGAFGAQIALRKGMLIAAAVLQVCLTTASVPISGMFHSILSARGCE